MDTFYETTSPRCRGKQFDKIFKLLTEIDPAKPESVLYGFFHHSNEGKKLMKKLQLTLPTKQDHPLLGIMKDHLSGLKDNEKEYYATREFFLDLLNKAQFTRNEVKNSLNITLSNDKWYKVRHNVTPKKKIRKNLIGGIATAPKKRSSKKQKLEMEQELHDNSGIEQHEHQVEMLQIHPQLQPVHPEFHFPQQQ